MAGLAGLLQPQLQRKIIQSGSVRSDRNIIKYRGLSPQLESMGETFKKDRMTFYGPVHKCICFTHPLPMDSIILVCSFNTCNFLLYIMYHYIQTSVCPLKGSLTGSAQPRHNSQKLSSPAPARWKYLLIRPQLRWNKLSI